ncbi:ABC transporter permease [Variovorax sp. Root318D1]|uniref:MFS transporter n=1 Tax=Variovorax sp. Root318D1 TaxID=1736513 RepID=UPI0006F46A21|nr:MFS transporter [Variovorax sp. Root318D1]KQU91517.1 ABC transporter permease [Variovorax sp. Root318D1]
MSATRFSFPGILLARLLPPGVDPGALPLLAARGLRAFGDGYMAVLLPAYLLSIGLGTLEVGIVSTATMLGSALATLGVGAWGYRFAGGRLLRWAALLMAATGLGFAGLTSFWPLLVVALVGTLNPSSGDVSVFLPLEHARLAAAAQGHARTALFARYSLTGALCAALGALAAAVPDWLVRHSEFARLDALRGMFVFYGAIGLAVFWLYRNLPAHAGAGNADSMSVAPAPLGPSRRVVMRLAALFSVDSFAGGLAINALMSLWLLERFGFSLTQAGVFFFWTGLLGAASQLAAPVVAQRIGLLNTMVFTHLPANVCLVLAALAPSLPVALGLLMVRSALSSMDVPTRTAYVMAVVTPAERSAAASFTAVPRSLAAAISPTISGALFAAGWISLPLIACGLLKISYDLALWRAMRRDRVDGE